MKSITLKTLATGIVAATLLFTGCKKATNGTNGATGPQGPAGVVPTSTDGFIKGTVTGNRRDGTAFTETFNYTSYWGGPAGTLDSMSASMGGGFSFNLNRSTDIFQTSSASINIYTPSLTNFAGAFGSLNFTYTQSIGTNKEFQFSIGNGSSATAVLTNVAYNKSTGQLTGNYTATSPAGSGGSGNNNTGNAATITGSFQSTITQLYYHNEHVVSNNKF